MKKKFSDMIIGELIGNCDVYSVLVRSLESGVSILEVNEKEYALILRYMVMNGQWNWDGKTFMNIIFVKTK